MSSDAVVIEEFAPAKVNLTLHVTGQRPDGYHELDSLVVFANVGDVLTVRAGALGLSVTGPFAQGVPTGEENAILRAAQLVGLSGAFHLEKNLPHPAGIGGGSADAAAAVRALCRLHERPLPEAADLLPLGADMPVCLSHRPQHMSGIGDVVSAVPGLPPLWMVLVNPGVPTPTGPIFQGLASKTNPPMPPLPEPADYAGLIAWLTEQRNDLSAPAQALCPEISDVLTAISDSGADLARMSGSGATCYGLYSSLEKAQAARAVLAETGWWVVATEVL